MIICLYCSGLKAAGAAAWGLDLTDCRYRMQPLPVTLSGKSLEKSLWAFTLLHGDFAIVRIVRDFLALFSRCLPLVD